MAIWDAYIDADSRHRYFLLLKDHFNKRIFLVSISIALFASGSIFQLALDLNLKYLPGIFALISSILGIYLATSNMAKQAATATTAALIWGRASNEYKTLWDLTESGKNAWNQHALLDKNLQFIDVEVTNNLETNNKFWKEAEEESRRVLA